MSTETIKELNELKITQNSSDWQEDLPENYASIFTKAVETGCGVDKHRWYETVVDVFEYQDRFIGVRYINQLYSETSSISDICWQLAFVEMEAIPSVVYRTKK